MELIPKNNWMRFTDSEIDQSLKRVLDHKQAITQFEDSAYHRAYQKTFDKDFPSCRIKNGQYDDCAFLDLSLSAVTFNGASFSDTCFNNAIIENTSLQSCNFALTRFNDCKLSGSNMSQSFFWKAAFRNTSIFGTTLLQSVLADCMFDSCNIKSVSFESCILSNTHFSNMRLADLNMEYAQFDSIKSDHVVYPFAQLPYIFGGLDYIFSTNDDVSVTSQKGNADKISIDEYHKIMEDLLVVYWSRREFFPLTHVCQCLGKTDIAQESIKHGIFFALENRNYRMLKFYCKQAVMCDLFNRLELRALYREIEKISNPLELEENDYYNYSLHLPEIKQLLLDHAELYPTLRLTIFTNIQSSEFDKLAIFLETFDNVLEVIPAQSLTKHVEIRHNSDFIVDFVASGAFYTIYTAFALYCLLLSGMYDTSNLVGVVQSILHSRSAEKRAEETHKMDMKLKRQEYEKTEELRLREREQYKIDMENKALQAKKTELEIEALIQAGKPRALEGQKIFETSNIVVTKTIPFISYREGTVADSQIYNNIFRMM